MAAVRIGDLLRRNLMANAMLDETPRSIRTKYAAAAALVVVGFLVRVLTEDSAVGALAVLAGSLSVAAMVCWALTFNRSPMAKAQGWLIVGALMALLPVVDIVKQLYP
jgi:hypothetical protein